MNTINSTASDYASFVQKAVKRNTAIEVIDAKQSGTPINKDELQASNQEIKDKAAQVGASVVQANMQKSTLDTYVQSTEKANETYSSESSTSSDQEIYTFDAQAANEARSTAQKRAIGISVYEQIQSSKESF